MHDNALDPVRVRVLACVHGPALCIAFAPPWRRHRHSSFAPLEPHCERRKPSGSTRASIKACTCTITGPEALPQTLARRRAQMPGPCISLVAEYHGATALRTASGPPELTRIAIGHGSENVSLASAESAARSRDRAGGSRLGVGRNMYAWLSSIVLTRRRISVSQTRARCRTRAQGIIRTSSSTCSSSSSSSKSTSSPPETNVQRSGRELTQAF